MKFSASKILLKDTLSYEAIWHFPREPLLRLCQQCRQINLAVSGHQLEGDLSFDKLFPAVCSLRAMSCQTFQTP